MALRADWVNHLILVESPQTTLVIQDLYNFLTIAQASPQGLSRDLIMSATGKFNLTTGVLEGVSITIFAPWKIKFFDGQYQAFINGGNIAGANGWNPFAYSPGVNLIVTLSESATIVEVATGNGSSSSAPSAPEIAAEVWSTKTAPYTDKTTFGGFVKKLLTITKFLGLK